MSDRPLSKVHYPFEELDRWLLRRLREVGPMPSYVLVATPAFLEAGGRPGLTTEQAARWLRSAERRQLIESRSNRHDAPPSLQVTEEGRARQREMEGFGSSLPTPFRQLLDKLSHIHSPSWATLVSNLQDEDPNWIDRPLSPDPIPIRANPGAASEEEALENLQKIKHIVVLMLENRSFDHMLGYLTLRGQHEVRGLEPTFFNDGPDGTRYHPRRLGNTRIPKGQDPCHSIRCVKDQIAGGAMTGFVNNFAATYPDEDPSVVMGFYSDFDVPVYDYFAHSFCVCDSWHAPVAGSTWVNRLYALTGQARAEQEGMRDGTRLFWDFPAFTQHLEEANVNWRWYSHDPATLRLADSRYRGVEWLMEREHFRYFDRKAIGGFTAIAEELIVDEDDSFLDDARHGALPSVAWIDPNFVDLSLFERNSNDDHPPSDIHSAQELVLSVFRSLVESTNTQFDETMLVVTYDEHGGFFDHMSPPRASDDNPQFQDRGVRVPAFVVSPLVEPGTVTHTLFDHTSLIRTILLRFAPDAADEMGARVSKANHLGSLLTRTAPSSPPPDYTSIVERLASLRAHRAAASRLAAPAPSDRPSAPPLKGFPAEMADASQQLRGRQYGLPAGRP